MNSKNGLFQMELIRVFMHLKNNIMDIFTPVTNKYGLNLRDAMVLYAISERNDLTVGDAYKSMNLNQGNFSTMCKKMEEKGYLIRRRDKRDQRTVILENTHKGEETLNQINHELKEIYRLVNEIPQEDIKKAIDGLELFANIMEEVHSKIED